MKKSRLLFVIIFSGILSFLSVANATENPKEAPLPSQGSKAQQEKLHSLLTQMKAWVGSENEPKEAAREAATLVESGVTLKNIEDKKISLPVTFQQARVEERPVIG